MFGQLNCATQLKPLKPLSLCGEMTSVCLCGPTGNNCRWDWVCGARSGAQTNPGDNPAYIPIPMMGKPGEYADPTGAGIQNMIRQNQQMQMQREQHQQELRNLQLQNEQIRLQNEALGRVASQPAPDADKYPVFDPAPLPKVEDTTRGICNGRWWLNASVERRFGYLRGLVDGMNVSDVERKVIPLTFPEALTWGEVMKAITIFFGDPLNGPIPIPAALQVVKLKAEGADTSRVEAQTNVWRAYGAGAAGDEQKAGEKQK